MDSPINIGDSTTNSIQDKLSNTHLDTTFSSQVYNSNYSGEKYIELILKINSFQVSILRRVQDSYINLNQLLRILVELKIFSEEQIDKYINNEVLENLQFKNIEGYTPEYLDYRKYKNEVIRGIWITFDKAIYISNKFGIYEIVKNLFLVNVHDFDELKKLEVEKKRKISDIQEEDDDEVMEEPEQSESINNPNYPYSLPPLTEDKNDIKTKFNQLFKKSDGDIKEEILKTFGDDKITDIPLDQDGKTALHFASTLGNLELLKNLIKLKINSPIRGSNNGENPLIACISVTNSMEKGNFLEILTLLKDNIFLLNSNNDTILHYLSKSKQETCNYYSNKLIQFIIKDESQNLLEKFLKMVNLKNLDNGNTALHNAIEQNNKWMINILLEFNADYNITNKAGVKAIDFDITKEIINTKKLNQFEYNDDELYLMELIKTSLEFMNKKVQIIGDLTIEEDYPIKKPKINVEEESQDSVSALFNSIKGILNDTNSEYESIINSKRQQIKLLNQQLFNTTLLTTNNKFLNKKINEKLSLLDNLKLQMSNITEKLEILNNELPEDSSDRFDADEPFRIDLLYNKLIKNEDPSDVKSEILPELPESIILKARIDSYKQLNENLSNELENLQHYDNLTNKFKKVVSFCTGVDINEVDELLDGLLEAVEGQQ
ncbi:hypothetical protein CLIB1444_03S10066 [[Candida] jaroonii]|uniref:Uncharacterized protein n=1 Tax=[Candida] jaroonii TaxID=467808 RepID=A0ACA9Y5X4_9ASCO|nr:hypothetical protein CLIB1444_03S10066 [[Candida] jaroonii]